MASLHELIRSYRKGAGVTQAHVAEACGVSRVVVTQWESGRVMPRTCHLAALFDVLELSVRERDALVRAAGRD